VCAGIVAAWADDDEAPAGLRDNSVVNQSVAHKMGYRTMANGSILYEEIVPDGSKQNEIDLENIAPAAGGDDDGRAPVFHYDPLTQTYRRVTVDKNGNTGQDVIDSNSQ
jgi:hypothetical protein